MKKKTQFLTCMVAIVLLYLFLTSDAIVSMAVDFTSDGTAVGTVLLEGDSIKWDTPNNLYIEFLINDVNYSDSYSTSGGAYTIKEYAKYISENSFPRPDSTVLGWKVKDISEDEFGSVTWTLEQVVATIYSVTLNYGDARDPVEYGIEEGKTLGDFITDPSTLEAEVTNPTPPEGYVFTNWKNGSSTYTGEELRDLEINQNITFTAQWVSKPLDNTITGTGEFYLEAGTVYTNGFSGEWRINGGADGCKYKPGISFYVPSSGVYNFTE